MGGQGDKVRTSNKVMSFVRNRKLGSWGVQNCKSAQVSFAMVKRTGRIWVENEWETAVMSKSPVAVGCCCEHIW